MRYLNETFDSILLLGDFNEDSCRHLTCVQEDDKSLTTSCNSCTGLDSEYKTESTGRLKISVIICTDIMHYIITWYYTSTTTLTTFWLINRCFLPGYQKVADLLELFFQGRRGRSNPGVEYGMLRPTQVVAQEYGRPTFWKPRRIGQ